MGGHVRVLSLTECPWIGARTLDWHEWDSCLHESIIELERRREAEEQARREARTPVYAYCTRCETRTAQCKNPEHRGWNQCMECGGGLAEAQVQHCRNCFDLPWREKREAALGRAIVYTFEEPPTD
jgi:hypothetical protein